DLAGVFVLTIAQNEEIRFIMNYKTDKDIFSFDTQEIKEALDGIPLNNNDIIKFLREMIEENLKDIEANQ
ncbi:MAG: ATP-binding protein, partial [Bacteroidales bacterium]|nr:ATP-binding protein [Bacteroidales bacterium]